MSDEEIDALLERAEREDFKVNPHIALMMVARQRDLFGKEITRLRAQLSEVKVQRDSIKTSYYERCDRVAEVLISLKASESLASELSEKVEELEKAKNESDGFLASMMDAVNQEIRENGPADVGQYHRRHDANNGVRYLADLLKRKVLDRDAKIAAMESENASLAKQVEELEEQVNDANKQLCYMAEGIYRGNTISYIYDKMKCYGDQVFMAFEALRLLGWKDESKDNSERAVALKAWASELAKQLEEARADVDEWKNQHENLLSVRQSDLAVLANAQAALKAKDEQLTKSMAVIERAAHGIEIVINLGNCCVGDRGHWIGRGHKPDNNHHRDCRVLPALTALRSFRAEKSLQVGAVGDTLTETVIALQEAQAALKAAEKALEPFDVAHNAVLAGDHNPSRLISLADLRTASETYHALSTPVVEPAAVVQTETKADGRKICTCVGACEGKQGLGPNWKCALEKTETKPREEDSGKNCDSCGHSFHTSACTKLEPGDHETPMSQCGCVGMSCAPSPSGDKS